MNNEEIDYLLNNYPYSDSEKHYSKSIDRDWYPIATKKCGKLLCISCDNYKGLKLAKYNNVISNITKKPNNTYICKDCSSLFNICQSCYSYCIINDNKKKKSKIENMRTKRYNIMYNSVKLNSLLVNIIYQYSLFDKLYHNINDGNLRNEKKYTCFCPRCEKRETINKSNLY
jgi:hypothetical protein